MNAALTGLVPSGVVVIVHGPLRVAREALARARALCARDGQIVAVAGTTPGIEVVRRLREAYTTVEGHGPDAVAAAIRSLDVPRVLVLHDDVEIDPASVAAMLTAGVVRDGVVVPAGPQGVSTRRDVAITPACALGSPDRLASLAEAASFAPGTALEIPDVIVAADAKHTHTGTCAQQLAGPDTDDGRPLLVAALIVRDEELLIGDCLASLTDVVDRIEVADTGSTDDTVAIAEAAGAVVERIGWRDDFAWARNQVLDRCRDAHHVLVIDADERLVCGDARALRRFLNTHRGNHAAYGIRIDNRTADTITHSHHADRLVSPETVRFTGTVHEQATRRDGLPLVSRPLDLCRLDHVGYAAARIVDRDKANRNLALARGAWEADPTVDHAVRYYRELAGRLDHPERTLDELGRVLPDLTVVADPAMQASLWALRGRVHLLVGDVVGALVAGREAAELCPADAVAGAVLAEALVRLGRHREALDSWRALAVHPSPRPVADDLVAAQTRAWALVRAAAAVGDIAQALDLIAGTSADVDPWPTVLEACTVDDLVEAATSAGRRDDARCIGAMLLRDLEDETVEAMRTSFAAAGGDLHAADAAAADIAAAHSWEIARDRFAAKGTPATALRYARTTAGAGVLRGLDDEASGLDLEGAADDPSVAQAIAVALEAAALAHRGAERADVALADAVDAVAIWPGALRAAALAAEAAVTAGMADVALELIDAARAAGADGALLVTPVDASARHELADAAIRAHLARGDLACAAEEAVDVIEDGGRLATWPDLLSAAAGDDRRLALVIGLALIGDGGDFVDAVARTQRAARTAELCLTYLAAGGVHVDAVVTGLLAAGIAGRGDLAALLADHGSLLEGERAAQVGAELRRRGVEDAARRLEREAGVEGETPAPTDAVAAAGFDDGLTGAFRMG